MRAPHFSERDQERERLINEYVDPQIDDHPHVHGVLLRDEIQHYATTYKLIDPFHPEHLKPAGYKLRVGDEYVMGGKHYHLPDPQTRSVAITIPPFQVVVLKTLETVNIPRFLIARWNVRVNWAYKGLLWVGGPQVDPGYVGHLFCPIYNLSDKAVEISMGDEIALVDFVKTTPFDQGRSKPLYPRPPELVVLSEYGVGGFQSALYTLASRRLKEFDSRISALSDRFDTRMTQTFTTLSVIIGALALQYAASVKFGPDFLNLSFVFALGALVASLVVLWRRRQLSNSVAIAGALAALAGAAIFGVANYKQTRDLGERIRKIESAAHSAGNAPAIHPQSSLALPPGGDTPSLTSQSGSAGLPAVAGAGTVTPATTILQPNPGLERRQRDETRR